MKKITYALLIVITLALLSYTGFYTYTHKATPLSVVTATTTEIAATTTASDPHIRTLTTHTGKIISVTETNPVGESLSTITITPSGFATNSPIVIEKNKLTNSFLLDINKDTFDELVIITTAQGSGSYGEATIYTTTKDLGLVAVAVPEVSEEMTKKGALFEGYVGHDTFSINDGELIREFPTATGTDTQSSPSGPEKKVIYTLVEKAGSPIITFTQKIVASTSPSSSTTTVVSLSGTSWTWVKEISGTSTVVNPKGNTFVLTFEKDGTVHSTTDCNSLRGSYVVNKDTLRFSSFVSKVTRCEGSQESEYSSSLTKASFFRILGKELTIILSDKGIMTFTLH